MKMNLVFCQTRIERYRTWGQNTLVSLALFNCHIFSEWNYFESKREWNSIERESEMWVPFVPQIWNDNFSLWFYKTKYLSLSLSLSHTHTHTNTNSIYYFYKINEEDKDKFLTGSVTECSYVISTQLFLLINVPLLLLSLALTLQAFL